MLKPKLYDSDLFDSIRTRNSLSKQIYFKYVRQECATTIRAPTIKMYPTKINRTEAKSAEQLQDSEMGKGRV